MPWAKDDRALTTPRNAGLTDQAHLRLPGGGGHNPESTGAKWLCECGRQNVPEYHECPRCGRLKRHVLGLPEPDSVRRRRERDAKRPTNRKRRRLRYAVDD